MDVNAEMTGLALDVVGRTIFDADVESEAPEIRDVLEAGMRVFHRFLLPGADLLWRLPLPATRRFDAAKRDVDAMLMRMIAERPRNTARDPGLLDHLLALRDEDGRRVLTDEQIRDEAITLMLAGHETTAQALTWTWYLLARNPEVEVELRDELRPVLGDRPPVAADCPRLPFTEAVVRESLRLYPPVWALARIATEPYRLGDWSRAGGRHHRHQPVGRAPPPEHFADPLAFRPRRWLDGAPPPARRLLPVCGRAPDLRRRALRDARGDAGAGGARAALACGAAGGRSAHRRPIHAAPARRSARRDPRRDTGLSSLRRRG